MAGDDTVDTITDKVLEIFCTFLASDDLLNTFRE